MDLRILKTKKAIAETFLELRKDKPLDKLYVESLCKKALINKSTFYRYYQDIYDLSDQLQKEAVKQLLEKSQHHRDLLTNSNAFIDENLNFSAYNDLYFLFQGQEDRFLTLLWEELGEIYLSGPLQKEVYLDLSFTLGGLFFVAKSVQDGHYSKGEILPEIRRIVGLLVQEITSHISPPPAS